MIDAKHTYSAFEFFYDDSFDDYPSIAHVDVTFASVRVFGGVQRINANWTPEIAQDLERFQGINVAEELERVLGAELAQAIDQDIIMNFFEPRN